MARDAYPPHYLVRRIAIGPSIPCGGCRSNRRAFAAIPVLLVLAAAGAMPLWFASGLFSGIAITAAVAWLIAARAKASVAMGIDRKTDDSESGDVECRRIMEQAMQVRDQQLRRHRELLTKVLNHIPHAVYWKDRDSMYLGCNVVFARFVGLTDPVDILGRTDAELPWPDGHGPVQQERDQVVMSHGRPDLEFEETRDTSDGERRTLLGSRIPLLEADGSVGGMLGIFCDTTERSRAAEALRESQAKLTAMLSQIPAVLWTTDTDLRVMSLAGGAKERMSLNAERVVGRSVEELFSLSEEVPEHLDECDSEPRSSSACVVAHRRALMGDSVEFLAGCGDRQLDVLVEPLMDGHGVIAGCIGLAIDCTDRRMAKKDERERKNLKEAVAAMEQVLGVIGHEIRTPLTGLRVMSEYLLSECSQDTADTESEPTRAGFIRSINEEVVRLSQMVNNMLEAARINSGRARWQWSTVPLAEVSREAIQTVAPLVDQEKVTIKLQVEPQDLTMKGDRGAIHRLLLNLLSNAQRHTVDGRIDVIIHRSESICGTDANWIDVMVRDTGCGISQKVAETLGVPFAQNAGVIGGSTELPNGRVGSGLGISICEGIAEAHGGRLKFESEVGKGTCVTAQLRPDLPHPQSAAAGIAQVVFRSAGTTP